MRLAKRKLGQSDLEISCLGLGTVKIGRNQAVNYPSRFSLPTDKEVIALFDQARELGINFLDTAPAYGSSEQRLGQLLKNRDEWIICSKVGEEFIGGKSFFDFSAQHTRRSVERSLRDLKTDHIDIVLIHSDGRDTQILECSDCLESLRRMQEEGVIGNVGMSTKTVAGGIKAAELMDVVMLSYNPSMLDDSEVIDHARALGKGVLIKKALNSGHDCKSGKSDQGSKNSSYAQENLQFALAREGVSSVVVGTINSKHLRENVASVQ